MEAPVFHATWEDMRGSFEAYVERIEAEAEGHGICKVVPPKGWKPRKEPYEHVDVTVVKPVRQHVTGKKGIYRTMLVESREMDMWRGFKRYAELKERKAPYVPEGAENLEKNERHFWKNICFSPPLYGADCPGSLFDEDLEGWNLRRLDSLLLRTLNSNGISVPGVTDPYLYVGMYRSIFAWHSEDMDLHSINYLHFGEPKSWYCVPMSHKQRFERVMRDIVPDLFRECSEFLRHKELVVSPQVLQQHQIPVIKMTQYPGEFVINFPGAYHSGFNQGFNCAESCNFATERWIPWGQNAQVCNCRDDSVRIDMNLFTDNETAGIDSEDEITHVSKKSKVENRQTAMPVQ